VNIAPPPPKKKQKETLVLKYSYPSDMTHVTFHVFKTKNLMKESHFVSFEDIQSSGTMELQHRKVF
jgi:hypothetical protein